MWRSVPRCVQRWRTRRQRKQTLHYRIVNTHPELEGNVQERLTAKIKELETEKHEALATLRKRDRRIAHLERVVKSKKAAEKRIAAAVAAASVPSPSSAGSVSRVDQASAKV